MPDTATAADTRAWAAELDRIELDVLRSEQLLHARGADQATTQLEPWHAPDLGPLPAALLPRAQELLARQQLVRARLVAALGATTRQQQLAGRITEATVAPSRPAYLDVTA